jgi:preprotein translocase subunit SecY
MQILVTFYNALKIQELRTRILVTAALLIVFRFGAHIPLPGVDIDAIEGFREQAAEYGGLWELLQIFSGGAIANIALFSLGIMPYITASIIMSLMTKVHPKLEAIAKEGAAGHRKINQYTRLLTIPICLLQGFMGVISLRGVSVGTAMPREIIPGDAGMAHVFMMVMGLAAGAIFIMWLGEQISEHGLGNGASVLIMAGIVDRLPVILRQLITGVEGGAIRTDIVIIILGTFIAMIVGIVFITMAQRRIPVQHAKHWKGRRVTMAQRSYIPLKVNQAGVMPVIFASSLMVLPVFLSFIPGLSGIKDALDRGGFLFVVFYCAMIVFFSYFWTFLFFPPDEWANNLKEHGSFIPGIRPGQKTAEYLDGILKRITLCGAAFLCIVALLPDIASTNLGLQRFLVGFLGGTSILIVVGVCQDLNQKIESYLLLHHYAGFMGEGGGMMRARR